MLSLRILGLRDVPRPPAKESLGQSKDMMNNRGSNGSDSSGVLWAVQVSHGSQQHRTQFVALSTTDSEMKDNMLVNAKEEKVREMWYMLLVCRPVQLPLRINRAGSMFIFPHLKNINIIVNVPSYHRGVAAFPRPTGRHDDLSTKATDHDLTDTDRIDRKNPKY